MRCDSYEGMLRVVETKNGNMLKAGRGEPCNEQVVILYLPSNDSKYAWSGRCAKHAKQLSPDIQTKPA